MPVIIDLQEYTTDADAQAAYVSSEAEEVRDSYSEANKDTDGTFQNLWDGDWSADGQAFTAGATYRITSCKFYLKKAGSPTGNAHAVLYAATGTVGTDAKPTGSALATSDDFDVSTLTTSYGLVTFTFPSAQQYELQNATDYVIVLEMPSSGTLGDPNYIYIGIDASSPSHGGNRVYWTSSAWGATSTQDDCFYLYGLVLQCFSEPSIKQEGSYSLKGIAVLTNSLNDTLTRTVSPTIDLSGMHEVVFDVYASRIGDNLKLRIHDSGGTWSAFTINVISSYTWENKAWNISEVADADKDAIDTVEISVIEAGTDNAFYIDNIFAWTTSERGQLLLQVRPIIKLPPIPDEFTGDIRRYFEGMHSALTKHVKRVYVDLYRLF